MTVTVASPLSSPLAIRPSGPRPPAATSTAPAGGPEATDRITLSRDIHPRGTQTLARHQEELAQGAAPLFGLGGLIFPDSHGRVTHLALQLGNVEFNKPLPQETHDALMGVWTQLFTNMSPETQFTVVCADQHGVASVERLVEETGIDPDRVDIIPAQADKGFSIWIRDSMLPVQDAYLESKLLIQDRTYWPGPEDNRVPGLIDGAHEDVYSQSHPSLRIDGGNILSNGHQIIVGQDSVVQTRERLQQLAEDPTRKNQIESFYQERTGQVVGQDVSTEEMWQRLPEQVFESEFGRPVLVVGQDNPETQIHEEQPAFHIDMAVTTIGEKKVLVGDPGMAVAMLKALTPEERQQVNQEMVEAGHFEPGSDIVGNLIEENDTPQRRADFDNTARELAEAGYEIERIPSMIGRRTTWSLPYLTYNNCIMEDYRNEDGQEIKKVYLPQYGCKPMDELARSIYASNGYEIVPLQMAPVSKLEGAIRCSAYPIDRDQV